VTRRPETIFLGAIPPALVLVAWLVSIVSDYDVVADVDPARAGLGSASGVLFGTDHMGRDVFWRTITASEAFVGPALVACVVALALGVPLGALAGYVGGSAARVVRYVFDVVASVPRFVLVLLACMIYGSDPLVLATAAGASYAPGLGQAVYARLEALRGAEFVLAARAHGLSDLRILGRHLLWVNCRRLVGRHLLYLFGFFLILETTLSYIGGFGIEEPQPSWGNMLAFEFGQHGMNALATLVPAAAIWLTVLGTVVVADGLAEPGDV
jgi:peptide/nickel transport system permease protein